jgi:peptidyl-prolyl cis-trans isomerase SurA
MRRPTRSWALLLFVASASPLRAQQKPAEEVFIVDRIVALVGDDVVLLSELDAMFQMAKQRAPTGVDAKAWEKQTKFEIVEGLISEKLLEAEVKKLRIDATSEEVDRLVQTTMRDNNLNEETFKLALTQRGMTLEEYRQQLKKQLTKMKIVQLKVRNRIVVSDDDVKSASLGASSRPRVRAHARHILVLVPPGDNGEAAYQKVLAARKAVVDQKRSFADVAGEISEDPGSRGRGGDLGFFGPGEMVPEFEAAAFTSPVGTVTMPVRTSFGWHILYIEERSEQAPDASSGNRERDLMRQQLYEKESARQFELYVAELKSAALIERRTLD